MVRGLSKFKEYFKEFPEQYVIIGGTATDEHITNAGLEFRVTGDIDLILVVEALNIDFVKRFWDFIKAGTYRQKEKSADQRQYYRFQNPEDEAFPKMLEIFSRKPDKVSLQEPAHLTPIPIDEDLSSLSAILMDEEYYDYLLHNSSDYNGLRLADISALVCLKAKAYLEINERIANGLEKNRKKAEKHKKDIFRLALLMTEDTRIELPASLLADFIDFINQIEGELPSKELYKAIGAPGIKGEELYTLLKKCYLIE